MSDIDLKARNMPPIFFHTLLASMQIGLLTVFCACAGVFTDNYWMHEYLGHLFIGSGLVALGALVLIGNLQEREQTRLECWLGIAIWAIWLIGDIFQHPPAGIFGDLDHAGNIHIGIVMLVGAAGVFGLALVRRVDDPRGLHLILPFALLAVVLPSHTHGTGTSAVTQNLSHEGASIFLLLGAALRFLRRPVEAGACFICAGYMLFSGQTGLPPFAEIIGQTEISWICYWGGAGLLISALYLIVFRPRIGAMGSASMERD